MLSALMFDRPVAVAPLERVATVLVAKADAVRVVLNAAADEVMRYLYVLSLTDGKSLSMLAGLLIVVAVVIGLRRSRTAAVSFTSLAARRSVAAG